MGNLAEVEKLVNGQQIDEMRDDVSNNNCSNCQFKHHAGWGRYQCMRVENWESTGEAKSLYASGQVHGGARCFRWRGEEL